IREVTLKLPLSIEFTLMASAWVIVLCDFFCFLFSTSISAPSLRHFDLRFGALGCVLHDGFVGPVCPALFQPLCGSWFGRRWLWPKTLQEFLAHSVSFFFSEHRLAPLAQASSICALHVLSPSPSRGNRRCSRWPR